MAKLNKEKAKAASEAELGSFEPLPSGVYHARLRDVDATREGSAGPYWTWEYEVVDPEEHAGRRIWNNTSLSDSSLGFLKATFAAFGADTDTDTDDLIGGVVKLVVSVRTIQSGARKGEPGNQVDRVLPKAEDFEAPETAGAASGSGEDIFS